MSKIRSHLILYASVLILFFIITTPFIYFKTHSYFIVHDNFDCEFLYRHLVAKWNIIWNSNYIFEQILNGLPRSALPTGYNVTCILFLIFGSFWGYVINGTIVRLIAFLGVYLLGQKLVKDQNIKFTPQIQIILISISGCFSLLPFYTIHGLTVAGIPLLIYSFVLAFEGKKENLLLVIPIITLYVFYSSIILSGVFIIVHLFLLCIILLFKKEFKPLFFFSACLLVLFYIFSELDLFYNTFFSKSFTSHRTEWNSKTFLNNYSLSSAYSSFKHVILYGHYHSSNASLYFTVTIPLITFTTLMFLYFKKKLSFFKMIPQKSIIQSVFFLKLSLFLFFLHVVYSFIFSFYKWKALYPLKEATSILKYFNFSRFHMLSGPVIFLSFFFCLMSILILIKQSSKRLKISFMALITIIILSNLFYQFKNKEHELFVNWKNLALQFKNKQLPKDLFTFQNFYDPPLFKQIKDAINRPLKDFRVISVGIHPAVAIFNGFYCLDSYQNNYPLSYKHEFREFIFPEIKKRSKLLKYYDNWGSRVYAFSSQLDADFSYHKYKKKPQHIQLDFNWKKGSEMGLEYVLSAVQIQSNHLTFINSFTTDESIWELFLYKLNL